jgi:hypothetical protein
MKNKPKITIAAQLVFFAVLLSSCESKYISLSNKPIASAWNKDKRSVAFINLFTSYKKPSGLGKIPDGGRNSIKQAKLDLYVYDLDKSRYEKIISFDDLTTKPEDIHMSYYEGSVIFKAPLVYYNICYRKSDSLTLAKYKNKYFKVDINTKQVVPVASAEFDSLFRLSQKQENKPPTSLRKIFYERNTLKDLGIDIREIYPESDSKYMDYIIYDKGNSVSQLAIVQQILPGLSKKQLHKMVEKMKEQKQKLQKKASGSYNAKQESNGYNDHYNEVLSKIKDLL